MAGMKNLFILTMVGVFSSFNEAGLAAESPANMSASEYFIYVGTYTSAKSKGIHLCRLNTAKGTLTYTGLAAETPNPTFLAWSPDQRFLYAVNEVSRFNNRPAGSVSAFAVEPATGRLTLLNQQSSEGAGPCHLSVDRSGKNVLAANYGGGSVACLPITSDGHLEVATAFIQHRGSSVNPQRQQGPHAHGIYLDERNRFALVPDLGLDQVLVYRFDPLRGALEANTPPAATVKPGAGPRHLAFHPQGHFAFVINELQSTVTVFQYEARTGMLKEIQTVSTLPADFSGKSTTAEVEVHPSGKFLYGSNRGHDSLAVFALDEKTGKLSLVQHQSTQGKTPRHFALAPGGQWLLAANQDSDNIVVFRLDPQTGHLTPTSVSVSVGAPVCIVYKNAP